MIHAVIDLCTASISEGRTSLSWCQVQWGLIASYTGSNAHRAVHTAMRHVPPKYPLLNLCGKRINQASQLRYTVKSRSFSSCQAVQNYPYGSFDVQDDNFTPNATPNPKAKRIGILGSGITGHTTAYHLAKTLPDAKITILEKSSRTGGWLDSEKIEVDGGHVVFEWGPRTLRAGQASTATVNLLDELGLADDVVFTPPSSDAARNRFIYYPDHLVKMPSGPRTPTFGGLFSAGVSALSSFLREPIFSGAISSLLAEVRVQPRADSVKDQSVGHFLERRFGKNITNNIASAVFHGIYAGDLYNLSAATILPAAWYLEKRDKEGDSVIAESLQMSSNGFSLAQGKLVDYFRYMHGAGETEQASSKLSQLTSAGGVYTLQGGLGQLAETLVQRLSAQPNIEILKNKEVFRLLWDEKNNVIVADSIDVNRLEDCLSFDYVVSTVPPASILGSLGAGVRKDFAFHPKAIIQAPDVMVVNLYYSDPNLIPPQYNGFGYLIPRSVPLEQNPERALGVIFGSSTSGPRPSSSSPTQPFSTDPIINDNVTQDTAPGTKLTVMLGGHWWSAYSRSDIPTPADAITMAQTLLHRHLKIPAAALANPALASAKLMPTAIPQYRVGYQSHMAELHTAILDKFHGRLKVAGPWYQGAVGVNDCTIRAREAALWIREGWDRCTGLHEYAFDSKRGQWWVGDRRRGTMSLETSWEGLQKYRKTYETRVSL